MIILVYIFKYFLIKHYLYDLLVTSAVHRLNRVGFLQEEYDVIGQVFYNIHAYGQLRHLITCLSLPASMLLEEASLYCRHRT